MRRFLTLLLTLLTISALILTANAAEPARIRTEDGEAAQEEKLDPKVEAMLAWAVATAEDDSHGYSKTYRFGPNYDCTSFVSAALMEGFGLDHDLITGSMLQELPDYGFTAYRRGETEPRRGDILIRLGVHAEICTGEGCVAAHQDYDGRSGDRTGHEIENRSWDAAWACPFCKYQQYNYILRYEGKQTEPIVIPEAEIRVMEIF